MVIAHHGRIAIDMRALVDNNVRPRHHGTVTDAGVAQHLCTVKHHGRRPYIGRWRHRGRLRNPATAVRMPRALSVVDQPLRRPFHLSGPAPLSLNLSGIPIALGYLQFQRLLLLGQVSDQRFKMLLHLRVLWCVSGMRQGQITFLPVVRAIDQVHVLVLADRQVPRPGPTAGQRDLVRVLVAGGYFVDHLGNGDPTLTGFWPVPSKIMRTLLDHHVEIRHRLGRRRNGQPETIIARLDLHAHHALVPQRAVATLAVFIHSNNARAPIAVRVWIVEALEVDGERCRAFVGYDLDEVAAVRFRGKALRRAVDPLLAIDRLEIMPQLRLPRAAQVLLLLEVELRPARIDLANHVAKTLDPILPQSTLLPLPCNRMHGRKLPAGRTRQRRIDYRIAPVWIVTDSQIAESSRIERVENALVRLHYLEIGLVDVAGVGQHLVPVRRRLSTTGIQYRAIECAVPVLVEQSARPVATARVTDATAAIATAGTAREEHFAVTVRIAYRYPVLVKRLFIPVGHQRAGMLQIGPEELGTVLGALPELRRLFRVININPRTAMPGPGLGTGIEGKMGRLNAHGADLGGQCVIGIGAD